MDQKKKILVLFYSMTGGTAKLAKEVATGASVVENAEVTIKKIPEILPQDFFDKNPHLKQIKEELEKEFPVATVDDLIQADGVAIGSPVHFGSFASQVKQYLDQLSPIWLEGKLVNKPVALFATSGSVHGGEETTLVSLMIPLLNLGMIPVGIPYPIQGESPDFDAGSPYGATFTTGHKGDKLLSEGDKKVARVLGQRMAAMAMVLNCGCDDCKATLNFSQKLS
ncbi:NAD(P)H:quinone oxidoreductase [Candidatus Daviesbacteria bacterium]|nr:NAD(P)H:quinone oxidoreductase [Candidatus Daviesbacteria bacterium]